MRPLILTTQLDKVSQQYFDELRGRHFPPQRNYLAAHLTMFHALPGNALTEISDLLAEQAGQQSTLEAQVSGLRSLGGGVAFTIFCPELQKMRERIVDALRNSLTQQDKQKWRPHITIQNKVSSEAATQLLTNLEESFQPWLVRLEGLCLWHYDGGPWELAGAYAFAK